MYHCWAQHLSARARTSAAAELVISNRGFGTSWLMRHKTTAGRAAGHGEWQPGSAEIAAGGGTGRRPARTRGRAEESIARSAPCGAATPLPEGSTTGHSSREWPSRVRQCPA
jgi:hypothetical protein